MPDTIEIVISIHAPARGATARSASSATSMVIFQSTLPRGERRRSCLLCSGQMYFNPRSREGSDDAASQSCLMFLISIHAPARGATVIFSCSVNGSDISIHAPARGATVFAHMGDIEYRISIHAPARGATQPLCIF